MTEAGRSDGAVAEAAARLQQLRVEAGSPSYAEIARRITERRMAVGLDEHAARVARSTVFDAFRADRSRLNPRLVREIAEALGGDLTPPPPAPAGPPARPTFSVGALIETLPTGRRFAGPVLLVALLANLTGRLLVETFSLPIHLDMTGTAAAALVVGAWPAAVVGALTSLLGVGLSGAQSAYFLPVEVVGALLWGYGARGALGRSMPRFLALNLLVALACSVVSVPILYALFDGTNGNGADVIVGTVAGRTGSLLAGTAVGNLLVSLADKLLSGFVALVVLTLPWRSPGEVGTAGG